MVLGSLSDSYLQESIIEALFEKICFVEISEWNNGFCWLPGNAPHAEGLLSTHLNSNAVMKVFCQFSAY